MWALAKPATRVQSRQFLSKSSQLRKASLHSSSTVFVPPSIMSNTQDIINLSRQLERSWGCRPSRFDSSRPAWELEFNPQIQQLLVMAENITEPTSVPAFLVQLIEENNQAFDHGRDINIEMLLPTLAPGNVAGLFVNEDHTDLNLASQGVPYFLPY